MEQSDVQVAETTNEMTNNEVSTENNWRDALPEEYRSKYQEFKAPFDVIKGYEGLVTKLGANPIVKPKEGASEEEVSAYKQRLFEELGVPKTSEDYKVEFEDNKDYINQDLFAKAKDIAIKHGVTPQALKDLIDLQVNGLLTQSDAVYEQNVAALKSEWGDRYEDNIKKATDVAKNLIPELLETDASNNSAVIKRLLELGKHIGEGRVETAVSTSKSDVLAEIAKLHDIRLDKNRSSDERAAAAVKALELRKKIT